MAMRITNISVEGFRNYDRYSLDNLGSLTVFVGRNGAGKTNLLEAIQLLTSGNSFRHPQIAQLIKEGRENARIRMDATDGNRHITTQLMLEAGKKRFVVNGKTKGAADISGTLPSVAFTPDDLQIAKKGSSVRRDALDGLGAQLTRNYHVVLSDYEKTLRYKNRLLKEEAPPALIDAINETLITCGSQLFCYRTALYLRTLPQLQRIYAEISNEGEEFTAAYLPSWDYLNGIDPAPESANAEMVGGLLCATPLSPRENGVPDRSCVRDILAESLLAHAEEERARHRSLVGPHNDKIAFFLAGRDASAFASQGQQRSIVLSWKLAEVEMVRQALGANPVLLLDDVMSELDGRRRDTLVNFASEEIQAFITATDLSGFNPALLERARVVQL